MGNGLYRDMVYTSRDARRCGATGQQVYLPGLAITKVHIKFALVLACPLYPWPEPGARVPGEGRAIMIEMQRGFDFGD